MSDMSLTTPPGPDALALAQNRPMPKLNLARGAGRQDIAKAAEEFEAVFISQMLSHMWSGVGVDPMFGGGHAEETFRGLMIEEQGKVIAKSGGLGLSDHIKRQLLQIQEGAVQP